MRYGMEDDTPTLTHYTYSTPANLLVDPSMFLKYVCLCLKPSTSSAVRPAYPKQVKKIFDPGKIPSAESWVAWTNLVADKPIG